MCHPVGPLLVERSPPNPSSPDYLLQGRDFVSQRLTGTYATPRAMSGFYPYQGAEPENSCYAEDASSDQPMHFASFQEPLWDETPFDSSADTASNQTVTVPPNYGGSSNYNDPTWSNAAAPSSATTSDVPPYSASPYPPSEFQYMPYPFQYPDSSSPPAAIGVAQDHTSVLVNEIPSVFALSHMSPPTAHNSPLPSTSPRAGTTVSPVPASPPVSSSS
ncbi:uncharacterized protein EV420DRAFT_674815 [Desarmillaria tabescens]|uniref:Uncharacterized protein n=1 Tax=Armillaria tabescens TaxID=1929756 RepID=A0AA39TQS8_ARMTA|nr:uncharacterized protein EV420DRAFT_674815 [Desarmillaria tabescens]KAK0467262.1 hypothetical protein EV420DRAFT_674815 [Desarmillaria tabescens]